MRRSIALMMTAAACSSGGDVVVAEATRPPISWSSEDRQVIDVFGRFRSELTDATQTKDASLDTVAELSSPRLSEALVDNIVGDRSVGNVIHGTYEFVPLSVTHTDEDTATILICAWDQTFVFNEGEQLSDVPEAPSTAKVEMQRSDGTWLVNGIFDGEGRPCELDQ